MTQEMKKALLILFLFLACGYSTRSLLPAYLKTISILPVKNETVRPGLGEALTHQLIQGFTRDGRLRVVESAPDLLLECRITNFNRTPHAYDAAQRVSSYKISMEASARCQNRVRSELLWEGLVSIWVLYDPGSETEEDGIRKGIEELSREILDKTLTAW